MFVTSGLTSDSPIVVTSDSEENVYADVDGTIRDVDVERLCCQEFIVDSFDTLALLPSFFRVEANIVGNPHVFVLSRDVRLAYPGCGAASISSLARSLAITSAPIVSREDAGRVARALEETCRGEGGEWWISQARAAWRDVKATKPSCRLSNPMSMVHMYQIVTDARDVFDSAYYSHADVRPSAINGGMVHEASIVDRQGAIVTCVGARPLRVRVGKNVIDVSGGYSPEVACPVGKVLATRVDKRGRFVSRIKTKESAWRPGARLCLMEEPFGGARRLRNHNKWIDQFGEVTR